MPHNIIFEMYLIASESKFLQAYNWQNQLKLENQFKQTPSF